MRVEDEAHPCLAVSSDLWESCSIRIPLLLLLGVGTSKSYTAVCATEYHNPPSSSTNFTLANDPCFRLIIIYHLESGASSTSSPWTVASSSVQE